MRVSAGAVAATEVKAIGFLDCCGFSAYMETYGDSAGVDLYLQMRGAVAREASVGGVAVVKWMGDGAMLAADGSAAVLACVYRTMVVLKQSGPVPVRAGITFGPVTRLTCDGLDYLGAAVNRAARLCARAEPWQVRASLDARENVVYFTLRQR